MGLYLEFCVEATSSGCYGQLSAGKELFVWGRMSVVTGGKWCVRHTGCRSGVTRKGWHAEMNISI